MYKKFILNPTVYCNYNIYEINYTVTFSSKKVTGTDNAVSRETAGFVRCLRPALNSDRLRCLTQHTGSNYLKKSFSPITPVSTMAG